MVAFTTLFAGFAATASIVAANPISVVDQDATVFKISNFFSRKYDGKNIAVLGFNISATNGGTLNFRCLPYDPATDGTAANFEDGKVYSCGKNSFFSFSFKNAENKLWLWQTIVTNTNIIVGNATIPNYCRAGGSSATDLVCDGTTDVNIVMTKSGA